MAIVDKLKDLYVKAGGSENESANTITEWLSKIYTVLGGNSTEQPSNIEDWIDKIEDVYTSGGGSGSGTGLSIEWVSIIDDTCTFVMKDPNDYSLIEATAELCVSLDDMILLNNRFDPASTIVRLTIGTVLKAFGLRDDEGVEHSDNYEFYDNPYYGNVYSNDMTVSHIADVSLTLTNGEGFTETSYTYPVKFEFGFITGLD